MSHWLNNCISLKFSWKKPPPGCSNPGCRARPPCWPPGRWAWSPACRAAVLLPAGWRTDCRVGHGTPWPAGWRWWELRCWTSQRTHHDPTQLPQCRPVHQRVSQSEETGIHAYFQVFYYGIGVVILFNQRLQSFQVNISLPYSGLEVFDIWASGWWSIDCMVIGIDLTTWTMSLFYF